MLDSFLTRIYEAYEWTRALRPSAAVLLGLKGWMVELGDWLLTFGPIGLFAVALLDSAFVPMPSGPDLLLVTLTALNNEWMLLYVAAATLGSTIGCTALYVVARRAGARALLQVSQSRRERIERMLGRYDMLAVMLASVLPPPFPFKVFVLCCGVFSFRIERFVIAILIGRATRYFLEGWLALRFGTEALDVVRRHGLPVFLVAGTAGIAWLAFWVLRRQRRARVDGGSEAEPPSQV